MSEDRQQDLRQDRLSDESASRESELRLALYQPEIAQNAGAATRAAACFGAGLDIIEPCGFPLDAKGFRRTAMDYGLLAPPNLHASWAAFCEATAAPRWLQKARLILLSTKGATDIWDWRFAPGDILMVGMESAGVPQGVAEVCDAVLRIPLASGARSLNMATAAAVGLAEARRQLR